MMEANSTPRLQAVTNQPARPAQSSTAAQPVEAGDNFEQQLSSQLEQASASSNSKNNENNQSLESSAEAAEAVEADLSATPEPVEVLISEDSALPLMVEAVEIDATETTEAAPQSILAGSDDTQTAVSETDQSLPITGNSLPPVDSELSDIEVPVMQPAPVMPAVAAGDVNAPVVQPQTTAKVAQPQPVVTSQLVEAEVTDEGDGFQEMEIASTGNTKQETGQQTNQSRQGIPVISSVAAAASQLQQVPLTTASANLNLPASAFPVDSILSMAMNSSSLSIGSAVQSQSWSQGLTEQVSWMMRGNIQSAEIRLNPAHLGPLEVKLSIEDDVARLSFVSNHAPVREALDAAIPRLREMLEQQGISLADVDVSQYSEQDQQSADEAGSGAGTIADNAADTSDQHDLLEGSQGMSSVSIADGLSIYA